MSVAASAALASLITAASPSGPDDVARFVVAVGYNGPPQGERPALTYADDDAARFYLTTHRGADRAWLLTTFDRSSARAYGDLVEHATSPTRQELSRVLGEAFWLIRQARSQGRRSELVLYVAGHGDVSAGGEGYLLLADGPFTRAALGENVVEPSPADVNHIVIDACASYYMVARSGAAAAPVPIRGKLLEALRGSESTSAAWDRTGVLVSTSGAAEVHESPELGGGVFSFLLRSGMLGAADVNGDGAIEYVEAAGFIDAASAALADERARLRVHARAPAQRPHAVLADIRQLGVEHFLVVDDARARHLRLVDAQGLPYAELHREGDARVVLALLQEPFYVVQRGDEEALLRPRGAGAYALSALVFEARPQERAARAPTGHLAGLFDQPFGSAFLSGFVVGTDHLPPREGAPLEVRWAEGGAPPFEVPWAVLAGAAYGVAGVHAVAATAAVVGNAISFALLQSRFQTTGTLDPALALQTDAFLTAAGVLGVGALAALLGAAGLTAFALGEDE